MATLSKRNTLFVVVTILIIALLLASLLQSPAQKPTLPTNLHIVVGIGTHGNLPSEQKALSSGVKYFRNDITLNLSQANQIRIENQQYGAQYLGILDYDTLPGGISDKNWTLGMWNASVANAIKEYPEISTWEIWNEPWYPNFLSGYMNGSAYNYYMIIKSAYTIIKAAEPNATIVCFGGAPTSNYNIFLWYSQVWSYGASNYCDAISIHAYPNGVNLLNQSGTSQQWSAALSAYENLTSKPIWITETGIPASSSAYPGTFSQQLQNEFLIQDFSFFNNFTYVTRVYWYDLWGGSDANDYGILNTQNPISGAPHLSWYSFMSIYNNSNSKVR